ncbi:DsbA family protein [Shewanella kaireitica]|uniref:DsbA family protein n=1 Tax=Shewanella kaireitica TaxID=212021 RepID=UPI00200FCCCE|nr:DsbA family protein [Shewanella kaireitica]MCL1093020.1 DsbA family protein [Shewanella kaireitica]
MPYIAQCLSSNELLNCKRYIFELKRKLLRQPHNLKVFIKIDDPYSYILLQALVPFIIRYGATMPLSLSFHPIMSQAKNAFPEPQLWQKNAFDDCQYLAELYDLNFPNANLSCDAQKITAIKALLACDTSTTEVQQLITVFEQFWQGKIPRSNNATLSLVEDEILARNSALLKTLGHYQAGTIYYGNEWYWGVDRLAYLEQRLIALNHQNLTPRFTKTRLKFDLLQPPSKTNHCEQPSLTLYFSIRSPYSHLGLEQAVKFTKKYQMPLIIKPVLPMVMRGLAVPTAKKMYIFHDTTREARRLNIDYGKVADPLGKGVERCYALFEYAEQQGKAIEYLLNYSRAVNSQGIHSDTDAGLKRIVERSGLDWLHAQSLIEQPNWRQWAQQNLDEMLALGLWGVPSFHYQDNHQQISVWGQDRIARIEQLILHQNG